jgi:hypothetical protein
MIAIVAADVAPWLAVAAAVGAALAVVGSVRVKSSLDVIKEANDELRNVVKDEKAARERDGRECDRRLAELSGRVSIMRSEWAMDVAREIAAEWRKMREEDKA